MIYIYYFHIFIINFSRSKIDIDILMYWDIDVLRYIDISVIWYIDILCNIIFNSLSKLETLNTFSDISVKNENYFTFDYVKKIKIKN